MNIKKGTFLDLATGWNTSSSHFLRDYDLTGTDSSDNGVKKATKISANNNINLMVDNILNSKLKKMDLIIF